MSENETTPRTELVLVTGVSGSGKSTVAKCFEDLGYHCIDNLPLPLLRELLEDPVGHLDGATRVVVVTDARSPGAAMEIPTLLRHMEAASRPTLVFLDASDETLARRFSETRRRHPLTHDGIGLHDAIREERELLSGLRGLADAVLDTSEWSIHEVRHQIYERFGDESSTHPTLVVFLTSFGYKHGLPFGTDLLFDVRFLRNPYFEPELRSLTGRSPRVVAYLEDDAEFSELVTRLSDLLLYLLPLYERENRSYLSVSVGCTGGLHRSVAVCERLAAALSAADRSCRLDHRDIDR